MVESERKWIEADKPYQDVQLSESSSKSWKRLKRYDELEFDAKGWTFTDGEFQQDAI
jgi:hypothetical protein